MKVRIKVRIARIVSLCLAVAFIAIGIYKNQPTDVFEKAVKICLECVGIG